LSVFFLFILGNILWYYLLQFKTVTVKKNYCFEFDSDQMLQWWKHRNTIC